MRACYGGCGRPIKQLSQFCAHCLLRIPWELRAVLDAIPVYEQRRKRARSAALNQARDVLEELRAA